MTTAEAARILELPLDATPEQIEAKFQQMRATLEDRIAKAPTPGLKAKYRESLDELEAAFEALTLAADSSALPVLKKEAGGGRPEAGGPASLRAAGDGGAATPLRGSGSQSQDLRPSSARKSGGREFLVVAVIALIVLGAGGWWVMKSRAENVEKARIAAEARAEEERRVAEEKAQAELARQAAEARRQAEEAEKARLAVKAKAEQERLDKLQVNLRAELAELRTRWEIFERAERDAERTATEAKSDLRSLRDAPAGRQRELEVRAETTEDYARWLADHLLRHRARTLRSRAEELVSARAVDEAQPLVAELKGEFEKLEQEIRTERERRLTITGTLELTSEPAGVAWSLVDAFDRNRSGVTPARVPDLGLGTARVIFRRPGWPEQTLTAEIVRGREAKVQAEFVPGSVRVESEPAGAEVLRDGEVLGRTPLILPETLPGLVEVELRLRDHMQATLRGTVVSRQELRLTADLEKVMHFKIEGLGLEMRDITPGRFAMGSASGGQANERPVTQVTISRRFWLGRTEVTQAQWVAIMGNNPSHFQGEGRPVEQVSWDDAIEFCRRLTERERTAGRLPEGYAYTLPTEAQWEYACRAGTTGDYAGNLDAMGWYSANSGNETHPVGQRQANAWGLHDMHGNVWEWCLDWYGNYPGGSVNDPSGASSGSYRVYRGGCWWLGAVNCRSAYRAGRVPDDRRYNLGFRLALSPVR